MIDSGVFERLFRNFPFEKTEITVTKPNGITFATEGYLSLLSSEASTDELGFIEKNTSTAFLSGRVDIEIGDQLTAHGRTFRVISLQDYMVGSKKVALKAELELVDV
ncbi:MAG: hypothetical protein ABGX27_07960 [Desulfurobacteriaceae bacterium]